MCLEAFENLHKCTVLISINIIRFHAHTHTAVTGYHWRIFVLQEELYNLILETNKECVKLCKPGASIQEIHNYSVNAITLLYIFGIWFVTGVDACLCVRLAIEETKDYWNWWSKHTLVGGSNVRKLAWSCNILICFCTPYLWKRLDEVTPFGTLFMLIIHIC